MFFHDIKVLSSISFICRSENSVMFGLEVRSESFGGFFVDPCEFIVGVIDK